MNADSKEKDGTILIVDDELNNLQLLSELFSQHNYKVRATRTGKEAMVSIRSSKPDILLLDIKLPDINGFEICSTIKADSELNGFPILFLSALNETKDIVHGFEVGGADFITKPFKEEEVIARTRTHIQVKQLRDKIEQQSENLKLSNRKLEEEIAKSKEVEYIRRKNEELQELNATKDKFFSIIAHDLRSPLSSFLGLIKMIASNITTIPLEEARNMILVLQKSAENTVRLLENLLLWSRLQRNTISFNPEKCNLSTIIEQNLSLVEIPLKQKEITLKNNVFGDRYVYSDTQMLSTVIRNLLSNAIKFTPRGGTVEILAEETGSDIRISIKDSGIGMNQTMINDLFHIDRKTMRLGTERESSTGLGLILCKEFVKKNRGKIQVESTVDRGSCFSFTMPKEN